jgi:hypothetical protein
VESETVIAKSEVPLELGVPEIVPELVLSDRLCGNEPDVKVKVYGAVPPVTAMVAL